MRASFDITLPVTVGVEAIKQNIRENTSSADLELKVIIKSKVLKSIREVEESQGLCVSRTVYEKDSVVLYCNQNGLKDQRQSWIPMYQHDNCKMSQYRSFPFSIKVKQKKNGLTLQYRKSMVNFSFMPVSKAKFVKNERLATVMSEQGDKWGLLSMDKSHRMMLQRKTTTFPIIGIWSNSDHNITSPQTMHLLDSYLSQHYTNKCKFIHERRAHIYFVKINQQRRMPQLYLIEYLTGEQINEMLQIDQNDINKQDEIVVESREKSSLEFTLRSDEKVPDKLMNISCSPIKFNDYRPFLDDSDKQKQPESPRFHIETERLMEQECTSLKKLVKMQAIQINELKAELLRLTSQMRAHKKHTNCYCSDSSITSRLSVSKDHQSEVALCKKLTQSDLNIDSISTNKSQLHPQSSNSSSGQQKLQAGNEEEEVWNRFEMQEGK